MKTFFGQTTVLEDERKKVSEGIGEGIAKGKLKRNIAISNLSQDELCELLEAESLALEQQRIADKLLLLGCKRAGVEWTQKKKKLKIQKEE